MNLSTGVNDPLSVFIRQHNFNTKKRRGKFKIHLMQDIRGDWSSWKWDRLGKGTGWGKGQVGERDRLTCEHKVRYPYSSSWCESIRQITQV
jgi:hypothetical protein